MNALLENIEIISIFVSVIVAIISIIVTLIAGKEKLTRFLNIKSLLKENTSYTFSEIESAISKYIKPDCQNTDPNKSQNVVRADLFKCVDNFILSDHSDKFLLVLASPGMGKTSFLINYELYFNRHYKKLFKIILFPLALHDVDDKILKIQKQESCILLLDGLDEDTKAYTNSSKRFNEIINITRNFHKVIITSRSEFYLINNISSETGLLKFGPRSLGESKEYGIKKIYISPFNEQQTNEYLKKRLPIFKYFQIKNKLIQIKNIYPYFVTNPMFLSGYFLAELLSNFTNLYDLYFKFISNIIIRNMPSSFSIEKVFQFYQNISFEMLKNKKDFLPKDMIINISEKQGFELDHLLKHEKTILTLTKDNNYTFTHKSFKDFFIAKNICEGLQIDSGIIDTGVTKFLSEYKQKKKSINQSLLREDDIRI